VVPPDVIFDNLDALHNIPFNASLGIYWTLLRQIVDFYNSNPNYLDSYNDSDVYAFDDGIIINGTLVHNETTIFTNHSLYITPIFSDLELCSNTSYNLSQQIFIYDIIDRKIYYGYENDTLNVTNITIDGTLTNCTTLGRQTMHDFILGKYGFSISFAGESWQYPGTDYTNYEYLAVGCIVGGIILAIAGAGKDAGARKIFKYLGILLIAIGVCIFIYIFVIEPILDWFGWLL
jgi:hypothetical protein